MSEQEAANSRAELNRLFLAMIGVAAVMGIASAFAWWRLPADVQIPVHWNADGNIDKYAGKTLGLFILPGLAAMLAVLFRAIPLIEPRRANLLRSLVAYKVTSLSVVALLLLLHLTEIAGLLGILHFDIRSVVGVGLSLLMLLLGNYLGKVRSNFLFGIRTPWTLSSNITWDKTHRLGGKLFVASGLAGLMLVAISPSHGIKIMFGLITASALISIFYSWWVWRTAPDRYTGSPGDGDSTI